MISDEDIMNVWLFCEGKASALNEIGRQVNFPILYTREILKLAETKKDADRAD